MGYKLMDIKELDEISYDQLDKIISDYEDNRDITEYRLQKLGSLKDPKTYELYDSILMDVKQSLDIKKRRAIAAQIKEANINDSRRSKGN